VSMSWVRAGERKVVPYENPQRRRYNTLALYAPDGVQPAFDWIGSPRAFTGPDLVEFLLERPPCPVPLVVVLDNASLHHSRVVQAALPRLWAKRIYFYFLPPYSPELNGIEPVFRVIKHCDLPERVYTPLTALEAAVDDAYTRFEEQLLAQHSYQLRPAA
jgi:putative transposase